MSEKALKKTKILLLLSLATSFIVVLPIWGCSNKGYSDPVADATAKYYANDATANTLVEPATVKAWVDNGGKTADGRRVIILDCVPNGNGVFTYNDTESWFAGDVEKIKRNLKDQYGEFSPQYNNINGGQVWKPEYLGHISGAIPSVSHEGYEVAVRNDGPIEAEHEVGTGALIDQMLQKFGVTQDDVIVLTTSRYDYPGFCPSRLWWTLYYWGFAKDNIKVLNGGNLAYAKAGGTLQKGTGVPIITASTFSVTQLAKKHIDSRMSLGELIALVDSGRTSLPDSDPNKVVVLDTRQPPAAFFFIDANADGIPDILQVTASTIGNPLTYDFTTKLFNNAAFGYTNPPTDKNITLSQVIFKAAYNDGTSPRAAFNGTTNPPIPMPNPFFGIHKQADGSPLAIPLGAKGADFEGIVKGAKITKTTPYNIPVPAISVTDGSGRYLDKAAMIAVFNTAGIDGTKPIVTYCNSGALASIYYYALHEICGYQNVRMYDGSWQEWAVLTAYEPADPTYVMNDDYTTFPAYPAGSPSFVAFAAKNNYFRWDATKNSFVDVVTGAVIPVTQIKPGGSLGGNDKWDVLKRSDFIMFRPTQSVSSPKVQVGTKADGTPIYYQNKTYSGAVDWPTVTTHPSYDGAGNEIELQDKAYKGSSTSTSTGGGATPFIPKGGGC